MIGFELTRDSVILNRMLKRYSHFFACLLLVLMPMQALATANMLVCNSMMQTNILKESAKSASSEMSCHQAKQNADVELDKKHNQKTSHQPSCMSVCANMCALTAIPVHIQSDFALHFTQVLDFNDQDYASITLSNPQRPPINFI